jgi:uncharacterized membrane protein YphA (DoxX/SURF4 family)
MESTAWAAIGGASRLVVAVVFIVAGATKLLDQRASITTERVALGDVLPESHRVAIWRVIGVIEVVVAVLALSPIAGARLLIIVMCAGALAYAVWAWRWRSQRPCGCFGAASSAPADVRTAARSVELVVLAIASLASPATWWDVVRAPAFWLCVLLAGVLFLLLSRELHTVGARRQLRCLHGYAADRRVATALPASDAWQRLAGTIGPRAPVATWNERCVRFLAFQATVAGQPAFAVFAVGVRGLDDAISGALVDGRGNPVPTAP